MNIKNQFSGSAVKTAAKTPVPQIEDLDTAPVPLEAEPFTLGLQASGNNPHESGQ